MPALQSLFKKSPLGNDKGISGRMGALVRRSGFRSQLSVIPAPRGARKQCTAPRAGEEEGEVSLLAEGTEKAGLDRVPDGHLP